MFIHKDHIAFFVCNNYRSAPEIQQRQESLKEELKMKEKELDALGAADTTAEHDKTQLNDTIDASRRELQTCEQNLMNLKRKKGEAMRFSFKSFHMVN